MQSAFQSPSSSNMASFVARLMSLNASELQCLHSDSELMRHLTETQMLVETRLQHMQAKLGQQHHLFMYNCNDWLAKHLAQNQVQASLAQNQQLEHQNHLHLHQVTQHLHLVDSSRCQNLSVSVSSSGARHLVDGDAPQRMTIDEDEDERDDEDADEDEDEDDQHEDHLRHRLRHEHLASPEDDEDRDVFSSDHSHSGKSFSSVAEPRNLKKSFIKRYRKFFISL